MVRVLVFKNRDLFFLPNFMEIVHVELTNKGRKLVVFEIFW